MEEYEKDEEVVGEADLDLEEEDEEEEEIIDLLILVFVLVNEDKDDDVCTINTLGLWMTFTSLRNIDVFLLKSALS